MEGNGTFPQDLEMNWKQYRTSQRLYNRNLIHVNTIGFKTWRHFVEGIRFKSAGPLIRGSAKNFRYTAPVDRLAVDDFQGDPCCACVHVAMQITLTIAISPTQSAGAVKPPDNRVITLP